MNWVKLCNKNNKSKFKKLVNHGEKIEVCCSCLWCSMLSMVVKINACLWINVCHLRE